MFKVNNLADFKSSKERVVQNIIESIRCGEISGGQRIDQSRIAKKEKVSLSTVRDSLQILANKGLVECIPGRGAYCKVYTISCFEKIMSIRRELEVLAAKEAAKKATLAEMNCLCEIADRLGVLVSKGSEEQITREHIKFHEYIAKISANEYLATLIADNQLITRMVHVMLEIFESRGLAIRDYTSSHTEYADHKKLAEVIAGRDLDKIDAAMRNHLTVVIKEDMRKKYGDQPLF